jgi:hypothetical protein
MAAEEVIRQMITGLSWRKADWGIHENFHPAGADDRKSSGPIPMKEKLGDGKA